MFTEIITMLDKIDIKELISIAEEAGNEIMKIYAQEFTVEMKENKTPLTEADKKSNEIILNRLLSLYPDIPFISEETKTTPFSERKDWNYFWLIDPLDGTKEFIKKNGEFTVNIALIEKSKPIAGVVYAPAKQLMYAAKAEEGSFKVEGERFIKLSVQKNYNQLSHLKVVGSRSHNSPETEAFVNKLKSGGKEIEFVSSGSSLKICLVAEGKADVYPRFGPTMEWDTAAGHAILEIAGGKLTETSSAIPLLYNKEDLLNPYFIASW